MIYNPLDCQDTDSPLGCPCPHDPDVECGGVLIWLGIALILGGLVAWWSIA